MRPVDNKEVVAVWKPLGLTPLQTLDRLRLKYPKYQQATLSYAGRLDPLVTGVMLILVDGANQERAKYLGLDKEYEFEVLFGLSSDTGDLLGLVDGSGVRTFDQAELSQVLPSLVGIQNQKYPVFSTPHLAGKKDFSRSIEIYNLAFLDQRVISADDLLEVIKQRISKVSGHFRQDQILDLWQQTLAESKNEYVIVKMKAMVTSGTYIRKLAGDIGQALNCSALAFSITRTKVGEYDASHCLELPEALD